MLRARALLAVLACCIPARGIAQSLPLPQRPVEVEIWGGLAQGSPRWGILGETPGMNVGLVGLRLARPLQGSSERSNQRLTTLHLDIVPLALVSTPYISLRGREASSCAPDVLCLRTGTRDGGLFPNGSAVGIGIAPLGITTHFRRAERVSPSLGVSAGALIFDRAVPTSRGAQFNFTAALEASLRLGDPSRTGFVLSYRLHHISNAGFAPENPGVASHLLTIGLRSGRTAAAAVAR